MTNFTFVRRLRICNIALLLLVLTCPAFASPPINTSGTVNQNGETVSGNNRSIEDLTDDTRADGGQLRHELGTFKLQEASSSGLCPPVTTRHDNAHIGHLGEGMTCTNIYGAAIGGLYSCAVRCVWDRDNSCFPAGTKILMGDGKSVKAVEQISEGDLVWNPAQRKAVPVQHLIAGPEKKPLIEIRTAKNTIVVTDGHPMVTQIPGKLFSDVSLRNLPDNQTTGLNVRIKRAAEILPGDAILLSNGASAEVVSARALPLREDEVVYNFELQADQYSVENHLIVANGVVTGDVKVQAKLNHYTLPWDRAGAAQR